MKATGKKEKQAIPDLLRQRAETMLESRNKKRSDDNSEADLKKLVHELGVHQIELELQNNEILNASEAEKRLYEKYIELYDYAPSGNFLLSSDGKINELNLTGANILGEVRSQLIRSQFGFFVSKESLPVFIKFLNRIFDNGARECCKVSILTKHNEPKKVQLTGIKLKSGTHCTVNLVDITELERAEELLLENSNRIELAMKSADLAWWEMDIVTGNIKFNKRKSDMLGFPMEQFTHYRDFMVLVHPEDQDLAMNAMRNHLNGSSDKYEVEYRIQTRKGDYIWLYDVGEVVKRDAAGRPLYVTGLVMNVNERKKNELALQKSMQLLSETEKIGKVGGWEFNIDTMAQKWTEEIYSIHEVDLNYDPNVEKGIDFYTPESRPVIKKAVQRAIDFGVPYDVELEIITAKGNLRNVRAKGKPDPERRRVYGFFQDITEKKQAEAERNAKIELSRVIFNLSPIPAVLVKLPEKSIVDVNQSFETLFGYHREETIGRRVSEVVFWADSSDLENISQLLVKSGKVHDYGFVFKTKSGQTGNGVFYSEIIDQLGNKFVISKILDITERKKSEEEILKSNQQLAELYKHLNLVREEERTSMAREIHDDMGQSLAGLKIELVNMKEDLLDKDCPKEKIETAIALTDDLIKKIRKISAELRPQMLDELGLASAIEWQSNEFKKRTGIKCRLSLSVIDDLDGDIAISLFRIYQASLTNIMLHSKAASISVKLGLKDGLLSLTIVDDGIGMTREQMNSSNSFGIIGMRERTNQINGKFIIQSDTNKGTKITVVVPLKR